MQKKKKHYILIHLMSGLLPQDVKRSWVPKKKTELIQACILLFPVHFSCHITWEQGLHILLHNSSMTTLF